MKQQLQLSGTGVALVTPFRNKTIDFPALSRLIEHTIQGGVDFIVSLGTTGEAITQSPEECREVLSFTVREVKGRVPVVAGLFGSNYTEKLVNALKTYDFEGIAAIMSSSPAYSKPSQEGIYQHYMAVAEASPVPVIIYNVPGRTCSNIEAETTLRLAHSSDRFLAVKEASGDLAQAISILKDKPAHFQVWSGEDPLTLPMIACGATGVISVIANAFPQPFSSMVRHARAGELQAARKWNDLLHDIHPYLYVDGNPSGIKGALEMIGICSKETRIPLVPLTDQTYQELHRVIEKAGLLP
ncbi:MAG: 4-hydroxy-tetrahydrodipicolinate synthase [Phaeodactylibacter xiamenensis]|uniref:4-hydroxy-tetrahydrodipicolinate synthase n=1 Tax=Phaeodactylibacter xiamenensis TaxID=1524460 RepID=A0A098S7P9_9BACT|nr:4-hydroxy-tetrahydrodipicolinate synthase [Phaeodactylibacter xiamenensis]KGE88599.1 dihydrodipicolinate synthase [Phaeodactylibacter xiamenensis]MCR9050794.1 4-hydroxy-tetrahydrodipicolinate synthase [bacterium]